MPTILETEKKRSLATYLSWVAMVCAPFLLMAVVSMVIGHNAINAYPVWSDELDYWRNLYSWDQVGFAKGYSGMFEEIPTYGTLSVHGITPILLYGWFVKLFGLSYQTIVIANLVWIGLGAIVFCALRKPNATMAWMFAVLQMVFVPIILYCTTSMTELFNYAMIFFYLAFLLTYHEKKKPWLLALLVLTVVYACLYRITYFLLFIPVIMVVARFTFGKRMIGWTVLAAVLSFGCYLATSLTTAPYIQGFLYQLLRAEDIHAMIQMVLSHTKSNLLMYFTRFTVSPSPMEDTLRVLYMLVLLLCLVGSFLQMERQGKKISIRLRFSLDKLLCAGILGIAFGIVCVLYQTNDWSDFRTLSPFLWLVLGYLLARKQYALPCVGIVGSLIMVALLSTMPAIGAFSDEYRFEAAPTHVGVEEAMAYVVYNSDATDPFENTVRTDVASFQIQEQLDPGMGLQYGWFTSETVNQSKWIVTDHLKCVIYGYKLVYGDNGMNVYRYPDDAEVQP